MALKSKKNPAKAGFLRDRAYKPGSVVTAIYLAPQLLTGSSHLLGTAGQAYCPTHGVAPDRVYIIKPMSPWAGCALTAPFHPCLVDASSISLAPPQAAGLVHSAASPLSTEPAALGFGRILCRTSAQRPVFWCLAGTRSTVPQKPHKPPTRVRRRGNLCLQRRRFCAFPAYAKNRIFILPPIGSVPIGGEVFLSRGYFIL